jgi:hypothetical protein
MRYTTSLLILLFCVAGVSFGQSSGVRMTPSTVRNIEAYLDQLDKIGYSGSVADRLERQTGYIERLWLQRSRTADQKLPEDAL